MIIGKKQSPIVRHTDDLNPYIFFRGGGWSRSSWVPRTPPKSWPLGEEKEMILITAYTPSIFPFAMIFHFKNKLQCKLGFSQRFSQPLSYKIKSLTKCCFVPELYFLMHILCFWWLKIGKNVFPFWHSSAIEPEFYRCSKFTVT